MSVWAAVDPDVSGSGFAVVSKSKVLGVGCVLSSAPPGLPRALAQADAISRFVRRLSLSVRRIDGFVVEVPVDYGGGRRKARPQDLIHLSMVSGSWIGTMALGPARTIPEVRAVQPAVWKGQVPKPIHQARICDTLGWTYAFKGKDGVRGVRMPVTVERFTDIPESHVSEVVDAVGLALWAERTWSVL